jgi:acyl-CoA thioesterase-1
MAAGALFAADPPSANPSSPAKKARIVILGDSITAGYGLENAADGYPAILQKKIDTAALPFTISNAGVSGDTTAGGLRRLAWALGNNGADILIVALGGNDGLRGIPAKQTAENLTGIVTKAREKNPKIEIIIAGMRMPDNMGPEYTAEFQSVFPTVAKAQKTALIPFLLEGVGGDPRLNQDDMIHPNPAGQKIVAETVWKALQPLLKSPPTSAISPPASAGGKS